MQTASLLLEVPAVLLAVLVAGDRYRLVPTRSAGLFAAASLLGTISATVIGSAASSQPWLDGIFVVSGLVSFYAIMLVLGRIPHED